MRTSVVRSVIASVVVGFALVACRGTPAPNGVARDFVAVTTVGDEVSGESIRAHVTIVDFWAVF